MAFWNDPSTLFPKQAHRWVISLGQEDTYADEEYPNEIPHYFAKSVDRPSYKIDTVQAKYLYAHTFNFPKRLVWNPIKIEFNDILITDSSEKSFFKSFIEQPKVSSNGKMVASNSNTKSLEVIIAEKEVEAASETTDSYEDSAPTFFENEQNGEPVETEGGLLISGRRARPTDTISASNRKRAKQRILLDRETIYKKTTQLFFYQFLQKCGYFDPNELERPDQLLRFRSYHFKKNMVSAVQGKEINLLDNNSNEYSYDYITIKEIDQDGKTIEQWRLYNPIITDISSGKLDYTSDGILSITVGITYDWAELVPVGTTRIADNELNREKLKLIAIETDPNYVPEDDVQAEAIQAANSMREMLGPTYSQEEARSFSGLGIQKSDEIETSTALRGESEQSRIRLQEALEESNNIIDESTEGRSNQQIDQAMFNTSEEEEETGLFVSSRKQIEIPPSTLPAELEPVRPDIEPTRPVYTVTGYDESGKEYNIVYSYDSNGEVKTEYKKITTD